ncbi:SDR family NAD(P)-dependent oxidoreductase [Mycolicibacterium neworleansense]|uniref:Dehydrogenase n=1 Tax=Mycolicibacterium neworleansense TaxID=146018 RepID=A0A0H5RMH0_9MYCO|nr:SDR family oxidoreductase [Mycolicibacterium neworleansense]MCV7364548.1 SDR family oxidoreductase [Mycolicibacterium neworleansense]CRZ15335.1 dehydrogenase [Mycolicibacterium neworleansense]
MTLTPESAGTAPGRGRLKDRRVVVVGAGSRPSTDPEVTVGNGRAIAMLSAREGAQVVCVDIDEAAAKTTADLCAQEGSQSIAVVADVRDAAACERLVHEAHEKLGGLDGVVANVGFGSGQGLAGTSPELWDDLFALNIRSHFLVARAAMPLLTDGSALVFIGSVAGVRGGTRLPAYDASKAGLFGLCRHVALEGAPRSIRANHVIPGPVDTPLGRIGDATVERRAKIRWPLGRQATAWDIAYATVFMLSGESAYITGQSLAVDGGITQFG